MKEKLPYITCGIALFFSLLMLIATSMAWFSFNKDVGSSGMSMQIEISPNLVISDTAADLLDADPTGRTATATNSSTTYYEALFTASSTTLLPATHYVSGMKSDATTSISQPTSNLVYVTNKSVVNASTGLGSAEFYYDGSVNGGGSVFYVDYTVYIASVSGPMQITTLTATLSETSEVCADYDEYYALSVDYYLSTDSTIGTFKGTLNIAGLDSTVNDASTEKTSVTLISGDTSIPLNTTGNYYKVTMRCYFDGALKKSSTAAYVNSAASISPDSITVKSHFTAE